MTLDELLIEGRRALEPCSTTPALDAEVLLAHLLQKDRAALIRDGEQELPPDMVKGFRALLERRVGHEPVHYIIGRREFWTISFKIHRGVLIPRPETELVVETALGILRNRPVLAGDASACLADLGTGSGNISVALACELPGCTVHAVDVSPEALRCARENAESSGVADRVKFHLGDLFDPLSAEGPEFDIIVSNPPYVSTPEMEELPSEVRDYEPHGALHGGEEGLCFLRRIIDRSPEYLRPGGALVLEIGSGQGESVLKLMEGRGVYRGCEIIRDYARLDRVALAYAES